MPSWMKEANWWMLLVTFIIGSLGLYSAEYGPLFNKGELKLFTKNYLNIGHDYGLLRIQAPIDVLKTGKSEISIFKMQLYLKSHDGEFEKLFNWNQSPVSFSGAVTTQINTVFYENRNMVRYKKLYLLQKPIKDKLYKKFKKEGWSHKAYFLKDNAKEVDELKEFVRDLLKDLTDSKYKILFLAFKDDKINNPIWSECYTFELSKEMISVIVDDQLDTYDSSTLFNNKVLTATASPIIEKLPDTEKRKLFNAYKNYASKISN